MENTTQIKPQEKITIGSEVGKKVNCSMCKKEGTTDQFVTLQGHKGGVVYLCPECKVKANETFENETKNPNMPLAYAAGIVGAIIGGIAWYFIVIATGKEIGYISIGLGYLVGTGVYLGSGKKRGHTLQIISALITIITIFVTEKFIFDYFINQYIQANISKYPDMVGHSISASFVDPDFLNSLVSPIGLLIYAIGIYFAYKICKPRKI